MEVNASLTLRTGLMAVCTGAYWPLPVCLDLHRASGETVGVKQKMANVRLHILPVVGTRWRCEHKDAVKPTGI